MDRRDRLDAGRGESTPDFHIGLANRVPNSGQPLFRYVCSLGLSTRACESTSSELVEIWLKCHARRLVRRLHGDDNLSGPVTSSKKLFLGSSNWFRQRLSSWSYIKRTGFRPRCWSWTLSPGKCLISPSMQASMKSRAREADPVNEDRRGFLWPPKYSQPITRLRVCGLPPSVRRSRLSTHRKRDDVVQHLINSCHMSDPHTGLVWQL